MKNLKSILTLITLTFLFTTISCSKDNVSPSNSERGTLSAEINGETFESKAASGEIDSDGIFAIGGNQNNNFITLSLYFNSGQPVEEKTYNYVGLGCFTSSETCLKIDYLTTIDNTHTLYSSLAGGTSEITITSIDFKSGGFAIGTFSGSITTLDNSGTITIANGKFNIKID